MIRIRNRRHEVTLDRGSEGEVTGGGMYSVIRFTNITVLASMEVLDEYEGIRLADRISHFFETLGEEAQS